MSKERTKDWAHRLRAGAPIVFACVGILAAAASVWLNLSAVQAAHLESLTPTPTQDSEMLEQAVELPTFLLDGKEPNLSRLANINTSIPKRSRIEILRYTVQNGDAVFSIAKRFGIEPETVLWGNFETLNDDPHLLRPGQELTILPVDGTYYQWKGGDSLEVVAGQFGVEPQAIAEWPGNQIDPSLPEINPGQWIIVPGGKRPFRQWFVPDPPRPQSGVGSAYGPGGCTGDYTGGAVGTGGFIWPTSNHYISGNDYWSGHLAIDIAAGLGTGVWAADGGVIVFAGWSTVGYGYMVMIDHGTGWLTLYGHLSQVDVGCGQSVGQGQRIGLAGSSGRSTGPHLHFETRFQGGFVNPWYVLP